MPDLFDLPEDQFLEAITYRPPPAPPSLSLFETLCPEDMVLADRMGTARHVACTRGGMRNKQVDWSRSNLSIHIDGARGELAYCRHFNLPPDLSMGMEPSKPDVIHNGKRLDVKATQWPQGRLMIYIPKPGERAYENIDIFVLTRLHRYPTVEIVGWSYKEEAMRDEYIEDVGHGPTWFVPTLRLHRNFPGVGRG